MYMYVYKMKKKEKYEGKSVGGERWAGTGKQTSTEEIRIVINKEGMEREVATSLLHRLTFYKEFKKRERESVCFVLIWKRRWCGVVWW